MNLSISRKPELVQKVVMTGGLDGCGKTLLTPIISALECVELPTYSYEIEHYCALYFLKKISLNTASALIRMQTDYKLYNSMMSREVNFRPTDLSSVSRYHNPTQYFQRLFQPGDEVIPAVVKELKPILNLTIHNVLFASEPLWKGLGNRCVYIEVVRHPLYMIKQQALNMDNLIDNVRDFALYYSLSGRDYIYWAKGWECIYDNVSGAEKSIHYIDQMTKRTIKEKKRLLDRYNANILTIPFEQFSLNPDPWIDKISKAIGANITSTTRRVMKEQNVPRDMVAQGIDLDVYRRCGWEPPKHGLTERGELNIRREAIAREVSSSSLSILDELSKEYESLHWGPGL
jgi:hypothetical protein